MKILTPIKWILVLSVFVSNAQQEKGIIGSTNWLNNWTDFRPAKTDHNESNQMLSGNITSNMTLFKKNTYLLQGSVYVTNKATLTIEPGTVIKGDSESTGSLIITKGATIIADGSETDPIVFTSNKPNKKAGDWGGVIILGDAPINKFGGIASLPFDLDQGLTIYGGTNAQSNSGIFRFVRIEFAGKKVKGYKEFNALSLAGVGNKTIVESIMASYSNDDSFEVYGGDVNLSKLVSYRSNDDDFDFTQGAQANITNSLAIRHSFFSSSAVSRCFEIDSYDKKEDTDFTKKMTAINATNISLVNTSETLSTDIASGLVKEAIYLGENSSLNVKRTLISGFNPAVILNSNIVIDDTNLKKIRFEEMYFNNCKGNIFTENNANNEDLEEWYGNTAFSNYCGKGDNTEVFIDIKNERDPDYRLKIAKITAQK